MAMVKTDMTNKKLTISPELGEHRRSLSSAVLLQSESTPPASPRSLDNTSTDRPRKLDPAAPAFLPRCRPVPATKHSPDDATDATPTLSPAPPPSHPHPPDELDGLIATAISDFRASSNWNEFYARRRHLRNDLGAVEHLPHTASHLLSRYKTAGVPVSMHTRPWNRGKKIACLERGPHQSAKEHIPFLREEFCGMINKGHWVVLPASLLLDEPELRLSPCGVVPQHDRRPRTISDCTHFGVNDDTADLAPHDAMQFGHALQRILQTILEANPRFGPVHMATVDIADGYYRMNLRPPDALRLGMLFPHRKNEPKLIAVPLVLPMGWKESPPAFCAATETVADLTNAMLRHDWEHTNMPHRLDDLAETPLDNPPPAARRPAPSDATPVSKPVHQWDICVDDFLGLAQGPPATRRRVKRALFHSLDRVFRPLSPTDHPSRQEPVSTKKLRKGDAAWATRKKMLGWTIDSVAGTITLTPRRRDRLNAILSDIEPSASSLPIKRWHKILGELRSMAIAIPGSRGLFSLLQEALQRAGPEASRVPVSPAVHDVLDDFRLLATTLDERPTRIAELFPTTPTIIGACDASSAGMGGVFFAPAADGAIIPFLWRKAFPHAISANLVSHDNPSGSITNGNLKPCGDLCHHDVIAQHVDVTERTINTLSDNVATVFWLRKGSTTTTSPPAYLLRLQAFHQRFYHHTPRHDCIPGDSNVMADKASRSWDLTDSQLVDFFTRAHPQTAPWRLCRLTSATNSAVTSALLTKRCATQLITTAPSAKMPTGSPGSNFAPVSGFIPFLPIQKILSPSSKFSPSGTETVDWPPAVNPSQLSTFQTSSPRWARRSPFWGPKTPATPTATAKSTSGSAASSQLGKKPMLPPNESNLCPSP